MKVAVIGAGWAGLAAATALHDADAHVTVFEAGRTPGGRARRVMHPDFEHGLDNGQHILLGVYSETLALMRRLGRNPDSLLMRRPLRLASLDGRVRIAAPPLPAPWHGAAALLLAHGLSGKERLAAMRLVLGLRRRGWMPPHGWTVQHLLDHYQQPADVARLLWAPLCLAAMNTSASQADARLFAAVLRDSLTGHRRNSDMLLPCTDLSALWPDVAARQVTTRYGHTVRSLEPSERWVDVNGERFDAAILAVPPPVVLRLLGNDLQARGANGLAQALQAFEYMPIATLNLLLDGPWHLPEPMMMLRENPALGHLGQWVFDRSRLTGSDAQGELAVVISAATGLDETRRPALIASLTAQLRQQAAEHPSRLPPMPAVRLAELFIEKRATFAATPGLSRPLNHTPWRTLALAGDWTNTGYPGVLEGAVRSGMQAARVVLQRA